MPSPKSRVNPGRGEIRRLRDIAIVHMRDRGYSYRAIGEYLGVDATTAMRRRQEMSPADVERYRGFPLLEL